MEPDAGGHADRPCVGPHIKRLRHERGLTLSQVAQGSGLNVGYLSQIENDKALPSLEALAAIGRALDVPAAWFLLNTAEPPRIVRAADRPSWQGRYGGLIEAVDGGESRDLRFIYASMPGGHSTGMHSHGGDEHHLVLSGRVRLRQGDHEFEAGPGDFFAWDASVPHDVEVIGDEPATMLIVTHRTQSPEFARPGSGQGSE